MYGRHFKDEIRFGQLLMTRATSHDPERKRDDPRQLKIKTFAPTKNRSVLKTKTSTTVMANTKDKPKALKDSTGTTVNALKRASDAIEKANPRPVKQTKTTLQEPPNLSTATPPNFLKDIILPDEDDVSPPPISKSSDYS